MHICNLPLQHVRDHVLVMRLQVEELNIDMEPGDIVDDILGERVLMQRFCLCLSRHLLTAPVKEFPGQVSGVSLTERDRFGADEACVFHMGQGAPELVRHMPQKVAMTGVRPI